MTETIQRKGIDYSESDRALAYILFLESVSLGTKVGNAQRALIARSRKVVRPSGSWSNKISNYIQADKFLRGETP